MKFPPQEKHPRKMLSLPHSKLAIEEILSLLRGLTRETDLPVIKMN